MSKIALITGGSTGIGLASVTKLLENNYKVISLDKISPDKNLNFTNTNFTHLSCDLSDAKSVEMCIKKAIKIYGKIGYVFSNAGVHLSANIENTSIEDLHRIININLKGTLYLLKFIIPHMKENKFGRIIFNSSDQAFVGKPNSTVYGATKAAVSQIAKSIAIDYSAYNIYSNAICPGTIDTPLYQNAINNYHVKSKIPLEKIHEEEAKLQPSGRIGRADEVANLVAFLFSQDSDFINGANLPIDGGYTAK